MPGVAFAAPACDHPRQMDGFKTCADVDAAGREGARVVYSPDPEANQAALLAFFHTAFPKINATQFVREWDRMVGMR
jgi:iron(III) transport system substrate-binding protein